MASCVAIGALVVRKQFFPPTPMAVPEYQAKPGEAEAAQERVDSFEKAAEKGEPARLELTAGDLNAMIARQVQGQVFVRIEGDKVLMDASIPLPDVPFLRGRYFNGTVALKLALEGDRLQVTPDSATVNGQPLPGEILKRLGNWWNVSDKKSGDTLRGIKRIEVRDGKVILSR